MGWQVVEGSSAQILPPSLPRHRVTGVTRRSPEFPRLLYCMVDSSVLSSEYVNFKILSHVTSTKYAVYRPLNFTEKRGSWQMVPELVPAIIATSITLFAHLVESGTRPRPDAL